MQNTTLAFKAFILPTLLLNILFVLSSIFWTADRVLTVEDARDVRVGFPAGFLSTNYLGFNDESDVGITIPGKVGFGLKYDHTFLWQYFFLDVVLIQILLSMIFLLIHSKSQASERYLRFLSVRNILIALFVVGGALYLWSILRPVHHVGWRDMPSSPPSVKIQRPQPLDN